jgi:SAM-dependent methyltransferase
MIFLLYQIIILKNEKKIFKAYNDLAWTERIICSVEDYQEESEIFRKAILDKSKNESETLLHLGCGAGFHDYTLKKYFKITGVDMSEGMLDIAHEINPDITYLQGDMQNIKLREYFDAVIIPDSIGYMTTTEDLQKAIHTAYDHLKPGGILLVVAQIREEFDDNNFVYTGSNGDINITLFENNYILNSTKENYEATFIYLIRRRGKLKIYNECHLLGLFKLETWMNLFEKFGLEVNLEKIDNLYEQYIIGEGEYPQTMFLCIKPNL